MNRLQLLSVMLLAMILAFLPVSCSKKSLELTYGNQESAIEKIVDGLKSANPEAEVLYLDGIVKVVTVPGSGESLKADGAVSFFYAGHYIPEKGGSLNLGNLFATNSETYANSLNWNMGENADYEIKTVDLSDETLVKGLQKGIEGVQAGEECYILFNGKYGFGKQEVANIPKNSALAYHLWVKGVSNR